MARPYMIKISIMLKHDSIEESTNGSMYYVRTVVGRDYDFVHGMLLVTRAGGGRLCLPIHRIQEVGIESWDGLGEYEGAEQ